MNSEANPEKSIRAQERLSAMIDSLEEVHGGSPLRKSDQASYTESYYNVNDNRDNDNTSIHSSSSSEEEFVPLRPVLPESKQQLQEPQYDSQSIHTPPDQKLPSSSSNSMDIADAKVEFDSTLPPSHPLNQPSGYTPRSTSNRYSMMSEYSGVIHEGTEISYVVKNKDNHPLSQSPDSASSHSLSRNSSHTSSNISATAQSTISAPPLLHKDVIIKQIKNAKPVSRFNSLRSDTPSKPPRTNLKYQSDPLLLIQDQTRQKLTNLSLRSNESNIYHEEQDHITINDQSSEKIRDSSSPSEQNKGHTEEELIDDLSSIQSSVVPPLTTTTQGTSVFNNPSRSDLNDGDNNAIPTVPPRNKNRPRTIIFDDESSMGSPNRMPYNTTEQPQSQPPQHHHKHQQQRSNPPLQDNKQFNAHTISQLLSMTNGTLIGSEFQDLPIPTEEKRSLERLVDSLSRLTADMVLDPDRYEEGLLRLKRAIRALEGFN